MNILELDTKENNCFAHGKNGKCTALLNSALTQMEKEQCGTLACPFYKPKNLRDGVRLKVDGVDIFYSKEEYEEMTGIHYLSIDEIDQYEKYYDHAPAKILDDMDIDDNKDAWIRDRKKKERDYFATKKKKSEPESVPKDVKMSTSMDLLKSELLEIAKKYNLKVNQMSSKLQIYEAIQNG